MNVIIMVNCLLECNDTFNIGGPKLARGKHSVHTKVAEVKKCPHVWYYNF